MSFVRQYPEVTKYVAEKFCAQYGVRMLYHSVVADVIVEGNRLKGVIIESKSGRQAIIADVVVDATGDADVAALSGVPFEKEDLMNMQPMTTTFIMGGASPDTWPVLFTQEAREIYSTLYEQGKYPIPRKG
jgi:ribulose 1,5-bisphosphate synthetase/thiazole synthase